LVGCHLEWESTEGWPSGGAAEGHKINEILKMFRRKNIYNNKKITVVNFSIKALHAQIIYTTSECKHFLCMYILTKTGVVVSYFVSKSLKDVPY
jgi:hypothetical protein